MKLVAIFFGVFFWGWFLFSRPFHLSAGVGAWDEGKTPHLLQLLFSCGKGELLYYQRLLNLNEHYRLNSQFARLNPFWKIVLPVKKRGDLRWFWDSIHRALGGGPHYQRNHEKHLQWPKTFQVCTGAWEEDHDTCGVLSTETCEHDFGRWIWFLLDLFWFDLFGK